MIPVYMHDCARARMHYPGTCNNVVYVHISIRVPHPTQDRMMFLKASFSKHLEWFCSTPLLYTGRDIEDATFSFFNEYYWFAPNSKFHSARKIKKGSSELICHEETTQGEECVARK